MDRILVSVHSSVLMGLRVRNAFSTPIGLLCFESEAE